MAEFKWINPKDAIKLLTAAQRMKHEVTTVLDQTDIIMNMTRLGRPPTEQEQGAMAASIIITLIECFDTKGQAIIMNYLNRAYYEKTNENCILEPQNLNS